MTIYIQQQMIQTTFPSRFIYLSPTIQGKRKMVDGFIRWCKKGDVGLSQKVTVESITDEEPTGLFDDFYVPTGR